MRNGLRTHTSPASLRRTSQPGCGRPTPPGFDARSRVRQDRRRTRFGRSVEDARDRVGERVADRGDELGRRRRRAGVGFAQCRQVVRARCRARGCAPTPQGSRRAVRPGDVARPRAATRDRRARSGSACGPATRRARSTSRPCGTAGTCTRPRYRPVRSWRRGRSAASWRGARAPLPSADRCFRS